MQTNDITRMSDAEIAAYLKQRGAMNHLETCKKLKRKWMAEAAEHGIKFGCVMLVKVD